MRRNYAIFFVLGVLQLVWAIAASEITPNNAPLLEPYIEKTLPTKPAPLEFVQLGEYDLTWFGIDVYHIRLNATAADFKYSRQTPSGPFELLIEYKIDIKRDRLIDETLDQWEDLGLLNEQTQAWATQLKTIWPNLKEGDSLLMRWNAENMTEFHFNGSPIGTISEPEFGPAFAAIWLDEACEYPKMRAALLGEKK